MFGKQAALTVTLVFASVGVVNSARVSVNEVLDTIQQNLIEKEQSANSTTSCYCACTESVYPGVFFRTKKDEVAGAMNIAGWRSKEAYVFFYVEVRTMVQGFGDDGYKLMRTCDKRFCKKQNCPSTKFIDPPPISTIQFLKSRWEQLSTEAEARIVQAGDATSISPDAIYKADVAGHYWGAIRSGNQVPFLLSTEIPGTVVAVHWIPQPFRNDGYMNINQELMNVDHDGVFQYTPPFVPYQGQLARAFKTVLANLQNCDDDVSGKPQNADCHAEVLKVNKRISTEAASMPRNGILMQKVDYKNLPR